eukprot:scaffold217887_cov23-Tisochrysis_lutea.AAC.1
MAAHTCEARACSHSSPHLVLVDLLLHVVQVTIGENDAHVVDQVVQDDPPLVVARGLAVHLDGALHHGVLAHQDDSIRAQGLYGVGWVPVLSGESLLGWNQVQHAQVCVRSAKVSPSTAMRHTLRTRNCSRYNHTTLCCGVQPYAPAGGLVRGACCSLRTASFLPHPADLLELHGANVVGAHDEGLVIGVQELAHLLVVCGLQ